MTIRFSWWGSDSRAKKQQEVIDAFEQEYPNITVEPETSSWDDYATKLSTQASADNLPDVMTQIDPFMYEYSDGGALLDLTTVSDQLDLSDFPEDAFTDVTGENGEIYGVSMGMAGNGLLINPTVFDQCGVALPDDSTWTWDDFEATALAISNSASCDAVGLQTDMDTIMLEVPWARQHGETFSESEDGSSPVDVDADTISEWFTFAKKLTDEGATESPSEAQEIYSAGASAEQSLIAQDKAAMKAIAANQIGQNEEAAGHEMKLVMWPGETQSLQPGGLIKQGTYLSIFANTDNPEAAATFVNYLSNNVDAARIMGLDRGVPANTTVAEALSSDLTGADKRFLDWVTATNALESKPFVRLNTGVATVNDDASSRAFQSVIFGQASPEEAANSLLEELNNAAS